MFGHARQHGHKFMVASDYVTSDGRAVKQYASFPTCKDFVNETLLKTDNRTFYELIPGETPCKTYLDIEWEGPRGPGPKIVHHVVNALKAYTRVRIPVLASLHNSRKDFERKGSP